MKKIIQLVGPYSAYLAWLIALASMLGSLYFSEILHEAPCILCWYQRILIYPLVAIIPIGILLKDKKLHWYVLPLTIPGSAIALYHSLLQWGIIPEKVAPCTFGVSCLTKQLDLFGFVTLPFLSLLAFLGIVTLMLISKKFNATDHE